MTERREVQPARIGCGPVGAVLLGIIVFGCVLLTIGSGFVVLFPGVVVDWFSDDGDPDTLAVSFGPDGTPTVVIGADQPLGSASNPAPLGATVTGDGAAVTLHGVQILDEIAEETPDPGQAFLLLDVTIANQTGEAKEFGSLFWSAKDAATGAPFDDEKTIRPGNALLSGSLAAGGEIRGTVLLRIDASSRVVRLKYDTAVFGGDNLYWLVNLDAVGAATPGASPVPATPGT